jgi:hypothetical protein
MSFDAFLHVAGELLALADKALAYSPLQSPDIIAALLRFIIRLP